MNKKRLCCFYANDIHLITMLLPYINERINESTQIITIFETDMSKSAKKVIDGIRGKKSKELLDIEWSNKNIHYIKESDLTNKLIIIQGSKKFIENVNDIIDNKEESCTILDCFDVVQGEEELQRILDGHDKIVNTSGEKFPEEVFTGYTQKIYKKITI